MQDTTHLQSKAQLTCAELAANCCRSAASYGGEADADASFESNASEEREPDAVTPYVILLSLAAALGGVLFGYDSVCYTFFSLLYCAMMQYTKYSCTVL
jgi:hypothetical protein